MGIPSYFSYILKKHANIIARLNRAIDNLYLDSNSISSVQRLLNASNLILEKEFNDIPKGITGLISGTYPFYTATQNTVCSVISTVMSTPEPGKAFVDCGQKIAIFDQKSSKIG